MCKSFESVESVSLLLFLLCLVMAESCFKGKEKLKKPTVYSLNSEKFAISFWILEDLAAKEPHISLRSWNEQKRGQRILDLKAVTGMTCQCQLCVASIVIAKIWNLETCDFMSFILHANFTLPMVANNLFFKRYVSLACQWTPQK